MQVVGHVSWRLGPTVVVVLLLELGLHDVKHTVLMALLALLLGVQIEKAMLSLLIIVLKHFPVFLVLSVQNVAEVLSHGHLHIAVKIGVAIQFVGIVQSNCLLDTCSAPLMIL